MANLYTRTGDQGETGLVGGSRVRKTDLRVECYGTVDEMGSALGLAKSLSSWEYIQNAVEHIQERLLFLAAEIASDSAGLKILKNLISKEDVAYLENIVDECTLINGKQTAFVIPGKNPASGALHFARTVVRRCERILLSLSEQEPIRKEVLQFLNRLSDGVYALARLEETLGEDSGFMVTIKQEIEKIQKESYINPPLTLAHCQLLAQCAVEKARELGAKIVFAAVDEGGFPLLLQRMDGAFVGSIDVALNKAFTANAFQMSTKVLGERAREDGDLYSIDSSNEGRIILFAGGLPYHYENRVVGGIGVSGGTVEQDMEIANYVFGK